MSVETSRTCLVVMYHYVRDSAATAFPNIRALTPSYFEHQLDWLQTHYTPIDLDTFAAALEGHADLPRNAALLTFDDGFVDHHETVFPMLRERGLTGTFFLSQDACQALDVLNVHKTHFLLAHLGAEAFGREVLAEGAVRDAPSSTSEVFGAERWEIPDERAIKHLLNYDLPLDVATDVLDRLFRRHIGTPETFARDLYLDVDQVRTMASGGMTFGYHTRSHQMLSRLDVARQREELEAGVTWVRELTGQREVPFCYPWGGPGTYTGDTLELLGRLGYSLAFCTVRRRANTATDGRFEVPRFDTRDLPPYTGGEADAVAASLRDEEA
jgi:peptidoglycan/xylan/chitin deacetylase (PgdA/CDA1 family)